MKEETIKAMNRIKEATEIFNKKFKNKEMTEEETLKEHKEIYDSLKNKEVRR